MGFAERQPEAEEAANVSGDHFAGLRSQTLVKAAR